MAVAGARARTSGAWCWAGAAGPAPPHPVRSSPERRPGSAPGASPVSIRSVVIALALQPAAAAGPSAALP